MIKQFDEANSDLRRKRAAVLRSIRTIDRPLAKFAVNHWRNRDAIIKSVSDAMLYGYGLTKVTRIAPHDPLAIRLMGERLK